MNIEENIYFLHFFESLEASVVLIHTQVNIEGIDSMTEDGELVLPLLASFAQRKSEYIREY